jgi:hypothetical protein
MNTVFSLWAILFIKSIKHGIQFSKESNNKTVLIIARIKDGIRIQTLFHF